MLLNLRLGRAGCAIRSPAQSQGSFFAGIGGFSAPPKRTRKPRSIKAPAVVRLRAGDFRNRRRGEF
jgi:hypothetical protein